MMSGRKQIALLGVFFVICMLLLTACTGGVQGEKDSTDHDTVMTITETDLPASEPELQIKTFKLGFSTDESDPRAVAALEFKRIVEEESEGNIEIELYPNGSLGADKDLIMGVINGSVDMTVSSAGNFANFANVGISAFPFLFQNFEEAWEFMDSPLLAEINEELKEYNIHVLAHFDNGFRCITTSEKAGPIDSLADMKDLSIRTSNNQIVMETMTTLGAKPKVLDFTLLYDALKNREFEAQENPIPVIYNHKLFEVQKYLAVTNHSYDAMPFVIGEDLWNSLTSAQQDIIEKAALKVQELNRELNREQTEAYKELLEEEGMIFTYPDLEAFKTASRAVYDYFAPSYGEVLMDKVYELLDEK